MPTRRSLSTGTVPRPLSACTRSNHIVFSFTQSAGSLSRTPRKQQFQMFPPQVLRCTNPLHYSRSSSSSSGSWRSITNKELGTSLLVPLFRALLPNVKSIGYSLAAAAAGPSWGSMSASQQLAAAALAIFSQPPVRRMADGSCYTADLRITRETEHVKFLPRTQPRRLRYAYIILQTKPRQIKIAAHQLIAWLSQGPRPDQQYTDYKKDWTPKAANSGEEEDSDDDEDLALLDELATAAETSAAAAARGLPEQQQQPAASGKWVVCHNDQPFDHSHLSRLKMTHRVETNRAAVPRPAICLTKLCINPQCLYYALQSFNSTTGCHHRTLRDKHSRQFAGSSCKPWPQCPQCVRAADYNKPQ